MNKLKEDSHETFHWASDEYSKYNENMVSLDT